MSYVDEVLQPGETILARATLHWIIYLTGLVVLVIGAAVTIFAREWHIFAPALDIVAMALGALGILLILGAWFEQWGTEIAVTNRRVIYKSGIISRRSVEMNVDQIESVEVQQTIIGRILGYGDVSVHGTGEGLENIRLVADPLTLRSAITAR